MLETHSNASWFEWQEALASFVIVESKTVKEGPLLFTLEETAQVLKVVLEIFEDELVVDSATHVVHFFRGHLFIH